MNLLHDRPKVTDIPPPGTDVLIEEVRRHYRRRLLATAIALLALAGLVGGLTASFASSPPPLTRAGSAAGTGDNGSVAANGQSSALNTAIARGRASTPWVVSGYSGAPFGDVTVAPSGTLYFIDFEYGQIDEVTPHGPRILLSSLSGGSNPNSSIPALTGLYATAHNLFFIAQSTIEEASLSGRLKTFW